MANDSQAVLKARALQTLARQRSAMNPREALGLRAVDRRSVALTCGQGSQDSRDGNPANPVHPVRNRRIGSHGFRVVPGVSKRVWDAGERAATDS